MIDQIRQFILPMAYAVLPPAMASDQATAMVIAIGWQESGFDHRKQINGPARGFWQFEEQGGVRGVLTHPASRGPLLAALKALKYQDPPTPNGIYRAIEHNDVLAAVCARLLLWTVPTALPDRQDPDGGWLQYISGWRPGKPHPSRWSKAWAEGWRT